MQPDIAARMNVGRGARAPLYAVREVLNARWSPPGLRNVLYTAKFNQVPVVQIQRIVPMNPNRMGLRFALKPGGGGPNPNSALYQFSFGYPTRMQTQVGFSEYGVTFQNGNVSIVEPLDPSNGSISIDDLWVAFLGDQDRGLPPFTIGIYEQVLAVERDADL